MRREGTFQHVPARRLCLCVNLYPFYFFGKFGSAFTSLICLVWRSLCAAMSRTNSYPSSLPIGLSVTWSRKPVALLRKSSVVARLSAKCLTEPSGDPKRFVGTNGSGACTLFVRSGTIASTPSSGFFTSRPGSPAGAIMTFSFTIPRIKSSAAAMCSITCATDQRSGAGLKFHCASERPFVDSRTFFFVVSRYYSALSFSTCVTSCADAATAPTINSNANSAPARDLVLIFFLSLSYATAERPAFLSSIGETGSRSIPHHLPSVRGGRAIHGHSRRQIETIIHPNSLDLKTYRQVVKPRPLGRGYKTR